MIIFPFTFFLEIAFIIIAIILAYEADVINNLIALTAAIFSISFALNPYFLLVSDTGIISFQRIFFPTVIFNALVIFHMILILIVAFRLLQTHAFTLYTKAKKGFNI